MAYKDPPKEHQFTSENNPGVGRPKGIKNFKTILRNIAEQKELHTNPITGEKSPTELIIVLAWQLYKKARSGDLKALEMILDRTEGKLKQQLEHSGDTENPIVFKRLFDE
jgi:hypothetical protein